MKRGPKQGNPKRFVGLIGVIAVAGAAALGYALSRSPGVRAIAADPNVPAGTPEGYVLGDTNAPVQVLEFGDFECPHCAQFANVTEPDIRTRLVNTGVVAMHFYDFPLEQFRNTWAAHTAAACAGDQTRFWEMHDRLYAGQDEWNTQATANPKKIFAGYAEQLGLDVKTWSACFDSHTKDARIKGNQAEGVRRHVTATPTFVIGSKQISMLSGYDDFKKYVDSALTAAKSVGAKKGASK